MEIPFHFGPAYKYCSADTIQLVVRNARLRFSRADTFNDAFELSPFLMPLNWDELVELDKNHPTVAKALANTAFDRVCSSLYITCFSKSYLAPTSQLMWAHYASNHRGVCIEIDFSLIRDKMENGSLYPVEMQYADSLSEERSKYTPTSPNLGMLIGATKSKVWEYEEEVRLVIESDSFDPAKFTKINQGKNIDVVFNPECISKVIFGLKSSEEDIQKVVESFCDAGHAPTFTRLDLDPLTLNVIEKDLGIREEILATRNEKADRTGEASTPDV